MKNKSLIILCLVSIIYSNTFAQADTTRYRYISVMGIAMFDSYNSFGLRVKIQYTIPWKNRWSWAFCMDNKIHLSNFATYDCNSPDGCYAKDIYANTHLFMTNLQYRIPIWKNNIGWTVGLGAGWGFHWNDGVKLLPTLSASALLRIRLYKTFTIELPPLLFLPPMSILYFSPFPNQKQSIYIGNDFFPIGFSWRL